MIHTVQLATNLTYLEGEHFKQLSDTTFRKPHGSYGAEYVNYRYSHLGIREARLEIFDTGPRLSVRANLNRLAREGHSSISPLPPDAQKLKEACSHLATLLPDFAPSKKIDDWHLSRIDYTADIKTDHTEEYIKLFQRGDKPNQYEIDRGRKEAAARKKEHKRPLETHLDNSCTYSCKTASITFYDKQKERIFNERPSAEVEAARNTIRFEMRFRYGKIKKASYACGWSANIITEAMTGSRYIADMAARYIYICCRRGDYYTLSEAKEIINSSKTINKVTKEKLIYLLELVNTKRSVWKARRAYGEGASNKEFNNLLIKLDKINVNPVTIPEGWGIRKLDNLYPNFITIIDQWRTI